MSRLNMQHWLRANARTRADAADGWYLRLANTLTGLTRQTRTALHCALYMQDAIAQGGHWTAFRQAYRRCCPEGGPVPFFRPSSTQAYTDDEINPEDVAFVLWEAAQQEAGQCPVNPWDSRLQSEASAVYSLLDNLFEEAPVTDHPSQSEWIMPVEYLERPSAPLPPPAMPDSRGTAAQRCMAYSGGHPLLYFRDYGEMQRFFIRVLGWEEGTNHLADLQGHSRFVIYANAKGMLVGADIAHCFRDVPNPMYDSRQAVSDAYRLFTQPGLCPHDLLKYALAHDLLPDAALPFPDGADILKRHRDFLCRYFLGEYYEGD